MNECAICHEKLDVPVWGRVICGKCVEIRGRIARKAADVEILGLMAQGDARYYRAYRSEGDPDKSADRANRLYRACLRLSEAERRYM